MEIQLVTLCGAPVECGEDGRCVLSWALLTSDDVFKVRTELSLMCTPRIYVSAVHVEWSVVLPEVNNIHIQTPWHTTHGSSAKTALDRRTGALWDGVLFLYWPGLSETKSKSHLQWGLFWLSEPSLLTKCWGMIILKADHHKYMAVHARLRWSVEDMVSSVER